MLIFLYLYFIKLTSLPHFHFRLFSRPPRVHIDSIYWIGDPDLPVYDIRYKSFQSRLEKCPTTYGIDIKFQKAQKPTDQYPCIRYHGKVGLHRSHIEIWSQFVDSPIEEDDDWVIILQDDTAFENLEWTQTLKTYISKMDPRVEVVYLDQRGMKLPITTYEGFQLKVLGSKYAQGKPYCNLQGVAYRKRIMKKLAEAYLPTSSFLKNFDQLPIVLFLRLAKYIPLIGPNGYIPILKGYTMPNECYPDWSLYAYFTHHQIITYMVPMLGGHGEFKSSMEIW